MDVFSIALCDNPRYLTIRQVENEVFLLRIQVMQLEENVWVIIGRLSSILRALKEGNMERTEEFALVSGNDTYAVRGKTRIFLAAFKSSQ